MDQIVRQIALQSDFLLFSLIYPDLMIIQIQLLSISVNLCDFLQIDLNLNPYSCIMREEKHK